VLRRSLTATQRSLHATRRSLRSAGRKVGSGIDRRVAAIAEQDTSANPALRNAISRPSDNSLLRVSGATMTLVGVLLLGFVVQVIGISGLSEVRAQSLMYPQLRYELAAATAPVAQVDPKGHLYALGAPVALLRIPAIGLSQVVVEGTTSGAMLAGPGHRRDTPLPGQLGASVIMGRQATYGGPFGAIGELRDGDVLTTTTGEGVSHYKVIDVRYAGDPQPATLTANQGRLTLVSATGVPYLPSGIVRVDATLTSKPFMTPNPVLLVGSLTSAELPLGSDPSGWLALTFLIEGAVLALVVFTIARRRWGRWHTWIVALPVSLLLGAGIGQQVVILLPNLY
jgi:sortase A